MLLNFALKNTVITAVNRGSVTKIEKIHGYGQLRLKSSRLRLVGGYEISKITVTWQYRLKWPRLRTVAVTEMFNRAALYCRSVTDTSIAIILRRNASF